MTIAIALKVGDGVVLGADSASSLMATGGIANVYFNAEKVSNLRKGLPIGMVTYGLGGLAGRSITSLAKDLRQRFSDRDNAWHLDSGTYTMELVANRVREFFYTELYAIELRDAIAAAANDPTIQLPGMGFLIAGFSGASDKAEVWVVEVDNQGNCDPPYLQWDENSAGVITWRGVTESLDRLLTGMTEAAFNRLVGAGVAPDAAYQILMQFAPLANAAMPIQDAIDLVNYLARVACGYVRFVPGAPTVAGPIDVAAITKHERFRWVRRKHYYKLSLNPVTDPHAPV